MLAPIAVRDLRAGAWRNLAAQAAGIDADPRLLLVVVAESALT